MFSRVEFGKWLSEGFSDFFRIYVHSSGTSFGCLACSIELVSLVHVMKML